MTIAALLAAQAALHAQILARAIELGHDPAKVEPIYDGVFDAEEYLASAPKVMWILKEPYDDFDAYLALWCATGEPELLAKARTLGDTITRVQTPEGRIPTFWTHDTLGAPLYDWLNCMGSSAATLLELDDAK